MRNHLLPRISLAALLAAYFALAVASSFVTRLRYGPDEPAHFVYVREIATHFRMPELAHRITPDISSRASHEAHQPPLYYALAAMPYAVARGLGADTDAIWRILRIFTALIGAAWVYCLYRFAREVFGQRRCAAVLAAACVGLLPSAVYIGGVVNNDALGNATFAAAMWLMLKCVRRDAIGRKDALAIGLVCGLAMLAKPQGVFVLPTVVAASLVIRWHSGRVAQASLVNAGLAIAVALVLASPWFIRNQITYGSPVLQSLYNPGPGWSLSAVWFATVHLFRFFWTPYWLVAPFVKGDIYTRLLLAFCLVSAVGVAARIRRREPDCGLEGRADIWALMALPTVLIYVFLLRHTLVVDMGALQQGRLLLPAAGIVGAGIVAGLGALIPLAKPRAALGALLAVGLIAANIAVIQTIARFYRVY